MTLMKSVQVAYHLTLTITFRKNGDLWGMTVPLMQLTTLFFRVWQLQQIGKQWQKNLMELSREIGNRLNTMTKISCIIANSLAYGLGVTQ